MRNSQPLLGDTNADRATVARSYVTAVRSMHMGQHVISALLLMVGVIRATLDDVPLLPLCIITAFLAFWYIGGSVLLRRVHHPHRDQWWVIGLTVVWGIAIVISPEFVWLAFPLWLLAGRLLPLLGAIPLSILILSGVAAASLIHTGELTYTNLIGPCIGGLFAFGISRGYVGLLADLAERQRLVESLLKAQSEATLLQNELAKSQRESGAIAERTRLSRDIHDTIAQGFSSIAFLANAAVNESDDTTSHLAFTQIETLARDSLVDVRRIVAALAPAELEHGALANALERMLTRLEEETGMATLLRVDASVPELPTEVDVALLRSAQSALANVRQHAGATRVGVSLLDGEDSVRLDIVDDGQGFDVAAWSHSGADIEQGGYGLHAMRARLRDLGGDLDVESHLGDGTALSAHIPLLPRTQKES